MCPKHPNGDIAPLVVAGAAIIGGAINVATHWDDVQAGGFGAGLAAFGIGAAGGVVAAYTGGAALTGLGLGSTGALSGLVGGAIGEAFGGPVTGIGNAVAFGDNYTGADWGKGILWGGVFGAGLGALDASMKGLDPWMGDYPGGGLSGQTAGAGNTAPEYSGPGYMTSDNSLGGVSVGKSLC